MKLWQRVWRGLTLADAPTAPSYKPACDRCGRPASVFISINRDNSQWCLEHRPDRWPLGNWPV